MKFKVLIALALIFLIAGACNKKNSDQNNNQNQATTQNQNASNNQAPQNNSSANQGTNNNSSSNSGSSGQFSNEDDISVGQDLPQVFEVKMTASGFSPATITIKKGDYIQFVNEDSAEHQPASGPHPVHTGLPGFDALKGLATGEKYRFQFNKTGSFGYHDHLNASTYGFGKVIVQ